MIAVPRAFRRPIHQSTTSPIHQFLAAALVAAVTACGGDNPPPPTTPPPSGDIPVTGHEQLGWTQTAISSADLRSFRFSAYIDEARAELATTTCQPTGGGSADCRSPLPPMTPGRHVLELTATRRLGSQAAESPRSSPLVLIVGSVEVTSATAEQHERRSARDENPSAPAAPAACSLTAAHDRIYVARTSGAISIHQLTDSPIHQLEWLAPPGDPVLLRSIATDPDYQRTHRIFLLLTSTAQGRLIVARYREIEGVMGEAAVLFDQPAAVSRPSLRFGPDGRIYIFLLSDSADHDPEPRPFIMRLNDDGSVPRENSSGSPWLDLQARAPSAAAWDADGQLWVIERDTKGSRLRLAATDAGEHIAMTDAVSMGFLAESARWFVGADGRIGRTQPGGKLQIVRAGSASRRIADALVTPNAIVACDALRPELDVYALRTNGQGVKP